MFGIHLRHFGKPALITVCVSCSVRSNSLQLHGMQPASLLCQWNSPSKNIGVDCHSLLQGIFPSQGSNLGLLHCRQIFYHLSHQKSPIPTLLTQIKPKIHSGNEEAYGTCDHQRPEKKGSCITVRDQKYFSYMVLLFSYKMLVFSIHIHLEDNQNLRMIQRLL